MLSARSGVRWRGCRPMRRIDKLPPGAGPCAVIPYMGSDEWFVDTGMVLVGIDKHVFVSKTACEELGKFAGFVPAAVLDAAAEANVGLLARIEQLEAELADAEAVVSAIDVIESRDFRARKRPGRKPKEPVNV